MQTVKLRELNNKKFENGITAFLFVGVFAALFTWLLSRGSMVESSGDAADIWKTITTLHTDNIHPSYVLYKGAMSVYPYTWFYRLATAFHINEFFFIKAYHALLFSYASVIGIPKIIKDLLDYKPKIWQRICLILFLFTTWKATWALDQLMVDLPSCAFFIMSINAAFATVKSQSYKRFILAAVTGVLTGLCMNISGQYSLAGMLLIVFIIVKLFPRATFKSKKLLLTNACMIAIIIATMSLPKIANIMFNKSVIEPMISDGYTFATAEAWMERALIYMQDKGRNFIGAIDTPRGYAILENYYGVDTAKELFNRAAQGGYGWSIPEYFKVMINYPLETLTQYFDRGFIALTTDQGKNSAIFMFFGYTFLYLAFLTAVRNIKRIKDFFNAKLWVIFSFCASIVPLAVMSIEMRCAIAFQGIVLGIGLAGPAITDAFATCKAGIIKLKNKEIKLKDMNFPWALLIYLVFMAVCFTHISTLYSTGGSASMLFRYKL